MKLCGYCLLILCLVQLKPLHGAKILGFFATMSRSHFIVEEPVMRELAKRGHQVTVVTLFKQSGEPLENYRYIEIPEFMDNAEFEKFRKAATGENDISMVEIFQLMVPLTRVSVDIMNHLKFIPLKNETFDLLVLGWFMNEYALGLSGHFKCSSVVISPNVNFYTMRKFTGNPTSVSTLPSPFVNYETHMSFFQRLKNFGLYLAEFVIMEAFNHFLLKPLYLEAFPADKYPSYDEVLKNVSLVLVSQHFSGRTPEPLLPGVIEVEGMHVRKEPNALPKVIYLFEVIMLEFLTKISFSIGY